MVTFLVLIVSFYGHSLFRGFSYSYSCYNNVYLEIITLGFWLSPAVSTRDPIIKPESVSSRSDNGRGLILRAMTKVPCYNLFITYSNTYFRTILLKNIKNIFVFTPK